MSVGPSCKDITSYSATAFYKLLNVVLSENRVSSENKLQQKTSFPLLIENKSMIFLSWLGSGWIFCCDGEKN